ncbi:SEFIR domain-containing protein [Phytohabitans rumicis]|uniref:SEFIR domain-containing protein n=1 Tax=Phytohabitans rumicis TaxID=1076125 RepID=UPI0015653DBD|nr:SEFIR domain-containing protein [Phytohabitans rumicis]
MFISYAQDDQEHVERVRDFYAFLRSNGIDARLDLPAAEAPQDWAIWMLRQIRQAEFVLIIASPAYRRRAEGDARPNEGRGVQFEARIIRDEVYADQQAALNRFLPVVLPGSSTNDIPVWLGRLSTTHYAVSEYTQEGAETLLRFLTGQPYEVAPPLGMVPRLPPRRGPALPAGPHGGNLDALVRGLADRTWARNEAVIQAQVRQLLASGGLDLDEDDLGVDVENQAEARHRIEIPIAFAVVEVRGDLNRPGVREAAVRSLGHYIAAHSSAIGYRYTAVLTDGAEWYLYRLADEGLGSVDEHILVAANPDADRLLEWLEAWLATNRHIKPTPQQIVAKLGVNSPAHALDFADLHDLYNQYKHMPSVEIKRRLWARLLTTALGTNFTDEDTLFINHTLLVVMAEIIGHAVVGIPPDAPDTSAAAIMSGEGFAVSEVWGVVERDFFDWVVEVPGGEQFIKSLARRLTRFAWNDVAHDVMKVLYESIISPETRHRLGEYYTPDWLAEEIVAERIDDPLAQRVLDASCGSGTFLFHAARRYLSAAQRSGVSNADAITGLVRHVIGIDVHPVAVTLARVTYLLAIGIDRIRDEGRPSFAVPVYLGDSLRWAEESTLMSYPGLSVDTSDDREIFTDQLESSEEQLLFPDRLVDDATRFDQLVTEMADRATTRRRNSRPPSLQATFERFGVDDEDQPVLTKTFKKMCQLHDQNRDHIWAYYVRNLARPLWLSRPRNRVHVLVGNPPWLAYRYMTRRQQASFRAMSSQRGLWAGATLATNQDLSVLFVTRCIELYLRTDGHFGYVMPLATLSRHQYAGFRTGKYLAGAEFVEVAFDRPWDLHKVKPSFFPVPASVVFGRRPSSGIGAVPLTQVPEVWTGRFPTAIASRAEAATHIARTIGELPPTPPPRGSPYAARFSQGATAVPRFLFLIESDEAPRLGAGSGKRAIRSRRSPNEKKPWKTLGPLRGIVETQFIRPLYVGNSILPFRCLAPVEAVIPWANGQLLSGRDEQLDRYRGLARWWRSAEGVWTSHRSSDRMELIDRLNFRRGLLDQIPSPGLRVVHNKSGMYLAAAILTDPTAIVDHELYWGPTESLDEARFLVAILNSTTLTLAVRPLQSRGEHNPRHFDKYVWQLPIPAYDPNDSAHRWLVALAVRAEQVASDIALPAARFEKLRRQVREALVDDGVAADIDAIVKTLLV